MRGIEETGLSLTDHTQSHISFLHLVKHGVASLSWNHTFFRFLNFELVLHIIFPLLSPDYLCPLGANAYNIEFTRFKLRDLDTQNVLFEVTKPLDDKLPEDLPPNATRFVRYQFPPGFLKLKTVGATWGREGGREKRAEGIIIMYSITHM